MATGALSSRLVRLCLGPALLVSIIDSLCFWCTNKFYLNLDVKSIYKIHTLSEGKYIVGRRHLACRRESNIRRRFSSLFRIVLSVERP